LIDERKDLNFNAFLLMCRKAFLLFGSQPVLLPMNESGKVVEN
jgi:hypothetical protein